MSYSIFIPHLIESSMFEKMDSKMFDFFKYEKDQYGRNQIVLTIHNLNKGFYSKDEAERILGRVTLLEVNYYGEPEKYYVSEASRLIAETFKEQEFCARILGLPAKRII